MLIQLRRHDGASDEIEVLASGFAREIATSFDWDAERRRFEHLEESGAESYLPSMALMDDAGRTLEFGPNTDDTYWVSYRYGVLKSSFGFCPVERPWEQLMEACSFASALNLINRHYAGLHLEIVSWLPDGHDPECENG
jgi:hypothetical protein